MDEHGAVFACHAKEEHPSMVVYKPFESWTTNAEWSARLRQDERAEAVALGGHFVVVGTSKQLLRVFNLSGMETDVSSIEGSIISACASRDRLCTVSQSQFSGEVYVSVYVVDSDGHITRIHHSPPGVSPKASLQWIGLSQVENDLVVMDSRCTFHLLEEKQKKWILLAEKVNEKLDATAFWPVTVDSQTAIGVNLFGDEKYPSVVPRSPVTRVQFDPVTVEPSKTRRALFDQRRRLRILKGALERREASESFHRDYEEDDNLLEQFGKHKVDTEKAVLKAVEEACKLKNASRALELTNTLQEAWALKLSLRLAEHYHLDNLRERMRLSIQARVQAAEAAEERKPHLRGPQNRTEGADMEALIKRVDSEEHAPAENEDIATPKQAKGGSLSERFKRKTEQTRPHPKGGVRATT
uniref:Minichromosome loss protein Mcl1 middle region domain-containing protein n=1 Tax=Rhodosorus marinus TaxID=101924 RepID=A0A7S3A4I3_9RHOD|mmetsp:Transcript_40975/g.162218  ORF Transcript_40975/g.162218 Transcript_40975/m.162218 type:complete len:413 (+) Transcript_40975:1735-2973(+)